MTKTNRHSVLVVDDEESMRELLEIVLSNDGYKVQSVPSVEDACSNLKSGSFDVVLTDLRIGTDREAGMRLLTWMQTHASETPSIMITL